jgi:hypothetical protein
VNPNEPVFQHEKFWTDEQAEYMRARPADASWMLTEDTPTVAQMAALQARLNLRGRHLVWIGEHEFAIAHTNEERETISLDQCALHRALVGSAGPPVPPGYYQEPSAGPGGVLVPLEIHREP